MAQHDGGGAEAAFGASCRYFDLAAVAAENGRPGMLQQVQQKLGNSTPTLRRINHEQVRTHTWPDCGKFMAIDSLTLCQNALCPAPENKPTPEHQAVLDATFHLLGIGPYAADRK